MRYDLRALNRAANQALGGRWVEVHHHAANHAKFGPRASNSRTSRCCVSCAPSNVQRVSCNSSIRRRRALVASLRCRRSPWPPSTLIVCDRRVKRLAAGDRWHDGDLIFASSVGTPMEPRNVNRRFNERRATSGLDWLRLHDLRHACATYLLGERGRTSDRHGDPRALDHPSDDGPLRPCAARPAARCGARDGPADRWRPEEPRWLHPWLQRSPDWRSFAGPNRVAAGQRWWRRRDLNPQPPPCKGGALPVELRPRGAATRVPAAGCAEISDGSLCLLWTERWMTRWTTR